LFEAVMMEAKAHGLIRAEAAAAEGHGRAVIGTDVGGTIVYWNRVATDLYGWDEAEALGRNILDVTPTQTSIEEATSIMECLSRGEPWTGSFLVRRRDGRPLIVEVTDVPVRADGAMVGIVGYSKRSRLSGEGPSHDR
jgi:PAS domain S-box-containing protein